MISWPSAYFPRDLANHVELGVFLVECVDTVADEGNAQRRGVGLVGAVFDAGGNSFLEQKVLFVASGGALGSDLYRLVVDGVGQELVPLWGVLCQLWVLESEVWGEPEGLSAVR